MIGGRRHRKAPAVAAVAGEFGRDLDRCLERMAKAVEHARARGAQLVVFPESALGGYLWEAHLPGGPVAVGAPPILRRGSEEIARLARIAGPTIVCAGYTEAGAAGTHSSAVCVNGDGVLGHHRKVHLPPGEREVHVPGEGFAAFDIGGDLVAASDRGVDLPASLACDQSHRQQITCRGAARARSSRG